MSSRRVSLLTWYGLLGAPFAWAGMHVAGYALTRADCARRTGGSFSLDAWTLVLLCLAGAAAALGIVSAVLAWRATKEAGHDELPGSRQHFLSVMGIAFSPLFLVIILMTGFGVLVLPSCVQS